MLTQLSLNSTGSSSSAQAHTSAYGTIQHELNELSQMLRELKRGASKLVEDTQASAAELDVGRGGAKKSKRGGHVDKASAAKSSWAKSATPRSASRKVDADAGMAIDTISPNLQRAERLVKTRAAAFTMAGRHPVPSSKNMAVCDAKYDVNVDALSSYKKVARTISFGNAPKTPAPISTPVEEGVKDEVSQRVTSTPKAASKAFSFGRAMREQPSKEEQPASLLDVERAKSYLEPHIASSTITKPPVDVKKESPVAAGDDEDKQQEVVAAGAPSEAFLSHRSRTPAAVMRPESVKNAKQQLVDAERLRSNPGPGTYEVASSFGASSFSAAKETKPPVGKLYHEPVRPNPDVLLRRAVDEQMNRDQIRSDSRIAPDLSSADRHIFTQTPSFSMHMPEPKPSAHLERKQYWEEKARDLRLEHDDLLDADDSIVRPRAPSVLMARPPLPPEDAAASAKMRRVLRERRRLNEQIQSLAYDVKFDAVERRSVGLVDMETAAAAQKKLQDALASKPAVQQVLAEKRRSGASDRVYGPQLQVPWAPEPQRAAHSLDECDSPIKQVADLLAGRRASSSSSAVSEHAEHYINSAYSGNLNRKATVVMRQSPPRPARRDETFESVLHTQLPVDWAATDAGVVDFDKLPGRDSKRVVSKGVYLYDRFDEPLSKLSDYRKDPVGPGYYERPRGEGIGEVAKGAPDFDLMVARAQVVGPNGERPLGSALAEGERALAAEAPTPVDYGRAKDVATASRRGERSLRLYERERFEERPVQPQEEAPAEPVRYFKGVAEAALARPPIVDFTRMRGRSELDREGCDDKDGGALSELNVRDWNPRLPKAPAVVFADPQAAPRFPEEPPRLEGPPPLDPQKIDYIKPKSTVTYVNMALQTGRKDGDDSLHVGGDATKAQVPAPDGAAGEDPLARGFEVVTRLKRTSNAVSIGKQVGRDGQAVHEVAAKPRERRKERRSDSNKEEPYQTDDALLAEILGQASPSPPRKGAVQKRAPVETVDGLDEQKAAKVVAPMQATAASTGRAASTENLTVEVEDSPVSSRMRKNMTAPARQARDWNFDAPTPPPRRRMEPELPKGPKEKEKEPKGRKELKGKKGQGKGLQPAPTPPVFEARPLEPAPPTLSKYEGFGGGSEELLQRELQKLGL